jgi:hypothetical protein
MYFTLDTKHVFHFALFYSIVIQVYAATIF